MTDEEIIRLVREHFEGLFPKTCGNCGRRFASLRDYILKTERTGPAISYDIEIGDWEPTNPLGALVAAHCTCGSTLALATRGMPLSHLHAGLGWVRRESKRRHQTPQQLLGWVRDEIRRSVIARPPRHK